jgi:hypothetical protein
MRSRAALRRAAASAFQFSATAAGVQRRRNCSSLGLAVARPCLELLGRGILEVTPEFCQQAASASP